MISKSNCLIITNNPLVAECMPRGLTVEYHNVTVREVLVLVRDLVYGGHRLYTHPLSGSVKPNETPYKSIAVSKKTGAMEPEEAAIIASSIETFDKFAPLRRQLPQRAHRDFQLIDYTLLCSAVEPDAPAGLSSK